MQLEVPRPRIDPRPPPHEFWFIVFESRGLNNQNHDVPYSYIMQASIVWATLLDRQIGRENPSARRDLGRTLASQLLRAFGDPERTIHTDDRGKPIVHGQPERHISIAHSGAVIAAAASTIGPIGIDVECHKTRDLNGLALAAFGPIECAAVATSGVSAFYRIWTLREAISKATGDGMALATDRIDRVPAAMNDGKMVAIEDGWFIAHELIAPALSMALALRVAGIKEKIAAEGCSVASLRFIADPSQESF